MTCLSWRAFADVGSDAIVACPAVVARSHGAVVDVAGAIGSSPSVHADAEIARDLIGTGTPVMTEQALVPLNTLIHVFITEQTYMINNDHIMNIIKDRRPEV